MRGDRNSGRLAHRFAILFVALAGLLALAVPAQAEFGIEPGSYHSSLLDSTETAEAEPQAGAHPFNQNVQFSFNTTHHGYPSYPGYETGPGPDPDDQAKTVVVELPPGLIGNPQAVPFCPQRDFPPPGNIGFSRCPVDSQIGVVDVSLNLYSGQPRVGGRAAVYNLKPPKGVLARIGFVNLVPVVIDVKLRSGGDYGLTATSRDISQVNFFGISLSLWGVPADASHDLERIPAGASKVPRTPFMSNPTRCGLPLTTTLNVDSWQNPGDFLSYLSPEPMEFVGCEQVEFEPSIELKPTTTLANAPSGQEFPSHIPQNLDPDGLTSAHLRDAVVKLPEGMTINPPAADVLSACSLSEIGMSPQGVANENPVRCPEASTLGKADVVTPSLDHTLKGTVYLARQNENPFGSPFAIYLAIVDPETGLLIN